MYEIEKLGEDQYMIYGKQILPLYLIHQEIRTFSKTQSKKSDYKTSQMDMLKKYCSLFSKLFIASRRAGEQIYMSEFFSHENQSYRPCFSDNGKMNNGTKSDLVECSNSIVPSTNENSNCESIIIDGQVMFNQLHRYAN